MKKKLKTGLLFFLALFSMQAFAVITLSADDALKIGIKIWHNESHNKIDGLTVWNEGEDFASIGIGHFIWYPSKQKTYFSDSFPQLIAFMKAEGITVPSWLQGKKTPPCPWHNRASFLAARNSAKQKELRQFLIATIDVQAKFIAKRLSHSLERILSRIDNDEEKSYIRYQFEAIAQSPNGIFALADYINFKGEGLGSHERYHNQGWGLLQVLQTMRSAPYNSTPMEALVWAANEVLTQRVINAPPHRNEIRWLKGWQNRIYSYL